VSDKVSKLLERSSSTVETIVIPFNEKGVPRPTGKAIWHHMSLARDRRPREART
jgi:hypothetical protein